MTIRILWLAALVLLSCEDAVFGETQASPHVAIQPAPERPIVEFRDGNQFLNFDLIVRNESNLTLRISEVELTVHDSTRRLVLRKSINTDAFSPSIALIG